MRYPILVFLLVMSATACRADILYLLSGQKLIGLVEEVPEGYRITTTAGITTIARHRVLRWEKCPTPQESYRKLLSNLGDCDFHSHIAMGKWCRQKQMPKEARYHYMMAVAIRPDDASARTAAGFIRAGDKWISQKESMQRKGFKYYDGQWMNATEAVRKQIKDEQQNRYQETYKKVWKIFIDVARGRSKVSQEENAKILAGYGPDTIDVLSRAADDSSLFVRLLAIDTLGRFACGKSRKLLLERLRAEKSRKALRLITARLVTRSDRMAILTELLNHSVNHKSRIIRRRANVTLRALADKRAIDALIPKVDYCPVPADIRKPEKAAPVGKETKEDVLSSDPEQDSNQGKERQRKAYYPAHQALIYLADVTIPRSVEMWQDWWKIRRPTFVFKKIKELPVETAEEKDNNGQNERPEESDSQRAVTTTLPATESEGTRPPPGNRKIPLPGISGDPEAYGIRGADRPPQGRTLVTPLPR